MKKSKIFFIVLFLAYMASSNAQVHQIDVKKPGKMVHHFKHSKSCVVDTLDLYMTGSAYYDTCPGGGYIGGINAHGDMANLEIFGVSGPFSITKLLYWFKAKEGSGAITATIWADSNGIPGAVIRRTTLPISSIDTSMLYTTVDISPPVSFPGVDTSFWAGLEYFNSSPGDTVGLIFFDGDMSGAVYIQKADSTFESFYDDYGISGGFAFFPVVVYDSIATNTPVAGFSATNTIITTGTSLQFTDQSTNIPNNWSWDIIPHTGYTYTAGTSSVSQNPQIIFNTVGAYTVALTAGNSLGSNSLTKTNYINVLNAFPPSWHDTIMSQLFSDACIDSLILIPFGNPLTPNDSGYITGQDCSHLNAFGQSCYLNSNSIISDVIVLYGLKAGATGNTYAQIYSQLDYWPYGPATLLGTSAPIVKSAIDTSNHGKNFNNVYHFPTPINVGSGCFVNIVMPATYAYRTDELAIYNSSLSCTNTGFGSFYDGGQWYPYGGNILPYDIDLAIFPVVSAPPASCYALYNIYPDTAVLHHYYVSNLASGVQPLSYLWSWGDGSYDSIPYPSHTYSTIGYYNICLTITDASGGCTNTYCDSSNIQKSELSIFSVTVIPSGSSTGIHDNEISNTINIFPNPASNNITITSSLPKSEIQILNIQGQLIKIIIADKSNTTINISDLASGMYFVKVTTDKGTVTKKIIKE